MLFALFRTSRSGSGRLSSSSTFRATFRHPNSSCATSFREYATSKAPPKPPPRSPRSPRTNLPVPARYSGRQLAAAGGQSSLRKIELAGRLFNAGDKTLYRSTNRTTFFRVNAWALTVLAGLGITYFWSSGLLNLDTYRRLDHKHPVPVFIAFTVTSVFLGGAAGWVLMKSWNHIHSIDLVQKSSSVFMQVTVRSGFPFVKRRLIIQPQDMVVDSRFITAYGLPAILVPAAPSESSPSAFTAGVLRETLKSFSKFFYSIFDAARVFFSEEGIIKIDIMQEKKGEKRTNKYFLDAAGLFLQEKDKIILWDLVDTKDPFADT